MGMSVGSSGGGNKVNSSINTTPLVDVMLVLLIIFLITIPVVVTSVKVNLPKETNQPRTSKPENILLAVNKEGETYWNELLIPTSEALVERLKVIAVKVPQPEVHLRGDGDARYEPVGRVLLACQRAGIMKISFVIEPPARQ
ncbi:MAG: biopolymer transporter ExbD [Sideroxydans sp.]|jgi:biopolymer transport protein ExbD|nr:biopolymer transporter ExbD [Sideroxydans sp.]